jgi:hypothetical protein
MSYGTDTTAPKTDAGDAIAAKIADYTLSGPGEAEAREHLAAAAEAGKILAAVIGTDDDELVVRVSGHANPQHKPTEGWADEFVQVIVARVPPAVSVPPATS